jgi:transposase-like protein
MTPKISSNHKRFTVAEKRSLLAKWARTTKSDTDFALEQGVGKSTLFKWRQKEKSTPPKRSNRAFVPVKVTPVSADKFVEIRSEGGWVVRVTARSDEDAVVIALKATLRCG